MKTPSMSSVKKPIVRVDRNLRLLRDLVMAEAELLCRCKHPRARFWAHPAGAGQSPRDGGDRNIGEPCHILHPRTCGLAYRHRRLLVGEELSANASFSGPWPFGRESRSQAPRPGPPAGEVEEDVLVARTRFVGLRHHTSLKSDRLLGFAGEKAGPVLQPMPNPEGPKQVGAHS